MSIPFDFTLIDARHRPFAEGRRETLLSLFQVIAGEKFIQLAGVILIGLLLLFWGGKSLIYDFSVEWVTTQATITNIMPIQSESKFNWWYLYAFETENGEKVEGKIVLGDPDSFTPGQNIPVRYVRADPKDNRYADESMPRSVRDWFFVAMSAFLLGGAALRLRGNIATYRTLRTIAQAGQAVPGEIIKIDHPSWRPRELNIIIEYVFTTPTGTSLRKRQPVSLTHLPGGIVPEPGTVVAVWCVGDQVALLL